MPVATGRYAQKASDSMPFFKSQGYDYITGAGGPGQSAQAGVYTMAAGGVVNFATLGLQNMADGTYVVVTQTSGAAKAVIARDATRTAKQFVITGPANGDTIEFIVYGALNGTLTK